MNETERIALAHEIWALAQLGPGEGIEDGAMRIAAALSTVEGTRVTELEAEKEGLEDIVVSQADTIVALRQSAAAGAAVSSQEPSDDEILQVFADVVGNKEDDARWIDVDRNQAIKIARDILSRYRPTGRPSDDDLQAEIDREVGRTWREDSSLDYWFPFTADELDRLSVEVSALKAAIAGAQPGLGAEPIAEVVAQDTQYHGHARAIRCLRGMLDPGTKLYTAPQPPASAQPAELLSTAKVQTVTMHDGNEITVRRDGGWDEHRIVWNRTAPQLAEPVNGPSDEVPMALRHAQTALEPHTDTVSKMVLNELRSVIARYDNAAQPASTENNLRLDAPAQVGNTRFHKGIRWEVVIAAAQRHYAYKNTPEREAERIKLAQYGQQHLAKGEMLPSHLECYEAMMATQPAAPIAAKPIAQDLEDAKHGSIDTFVKRVDSVNVSAYLNDGQPDLAMAWDEIGKKLQGMADDAYRRYIDQLSKDECKGEKYKQENGKFGVAELAAHRRAYEFLGRNRAFSEAVALLKRIQPASSPEAYCEPCQSAGLSNCSDFTHCGNVRCITCKRLLDDVQPASGEDDLTAAARDVLAERRRQVEAEGWTTERDDQYSSGEMAEAAAAYAGESAQSHAGLPNGWPWSAQWWKPGTPRQNLVKAGALILAEIERLDRAAMQKGGKS